MTADLSALQERLGYEFQNLDLLRLALTHPSAVHEQAGVSQHNQRLEFLGDAVLQLILTRELFLQYPTVNEGPLTKARAHLVNRRTLAELGQRLELGGYLVLSRGEDTSGGRERPSTLADAFEAVLGAVFLDGGFPAASEIVLRQFQDMFQGQGVIPHLDNPKGELQEMLQSKSPDPPRYQIESVTGPDHDRLFECAVFHDGVELGRGRGKSKKTAEGEAALAALTRLRASQAPVENQTG